jgi:high affinity Mn2+ porin
VIKLPWFISVCIFGPGLIIASAISSSCQTTDTVVKDQRWNLHFQSTVIWQLHPAFHASYSGQNSLSSGFESPLSVTSTLFLGVRLWHNASVCFNPELSGGGGFSQTTGIAGFPNGEVYRVSDPQPHVYVARLYLKQVFPVSNGRSWQEDEANQPGGKSPSEYFALYAGKFSIMDFFDDNRFSHDPRMQFFNWALMGNGAWDYPANTRGYTYGLTLECVMKKWALRIGSVMVPKSANGSVMDPDVLRSNSEALEFEYHCDLGHRPGTLRFITYLTQARMGNYRQAMEWGTAHDTTPFVDSTRALGRIKYGFGLNLEQDIADHIGIFLRAGWNDGRNETWVFTEIDRTLSLGLHLNGHLWKRSDDQIGVATIFNGLSTDHKHYLESGGYGFIIGDGKLKYGPECIAEIYYSLKIMQYPLWLTADYQFILNPAYNCDRGPVHAPGIRLHVEF